MLEKTVAPNQQMLKNQASDLCSLGNQIHEGGNVLLLFLITVLRVPYSYVIEGTQQNKNEWINHFLTCVCLLAFMYVDSLSVTEKSDII